MTAFPTRRISLRLMVVSLLLCLCQGCDRPEEAPVKVSLSTTEDSTIVKENKTSGTLYIAVSAVISPEETFVLYKDLLDYIAEKIGVKVELVQRQTYEEVNNLVRDNKLVLAFVCSGAYVDGHDTFGMELLVAPVAYGEPVYYSYIIVPQSSTAKDLNDLQGKRFAFTDPMSNTGKLVPTYMLSSQGEDIETFFSEYIFTFSHDRSIEMVAYALVDGAAVDSLIWEYMNSTDPSLTSRTRIIRKSEPFGIPPVVVPSSLDETMKEKLRQLFLNIHTEEKGRKIIEKLHIDKYVIQDDRQYDSIRKMQRVVSEQ